MDTPKSTADNESPSTSSLFLPLRRLSRRGSRRGSLASLSASSQVDKDTISQALDQIHNTASQSESLTTFNEFTSLPPSSTGKEEKGISGDIHGGFSGLYSRLKASVGGIKDNIPAEDADERGFEDVPAKSPKVSAPSTAMKSRQSMSSTRHASPHQSLNGDLDLSTMQSPLGSMTSELSSSGPGSMLKLSKISTAAATSTAHPLSSGLKSPPAPVTRAINPKRPGTGLAGTRSKSSLDADVHQGNIDANGVELIHGHITSPVALNREEHRVGSANKKRTVSMKMDPGKSLKPIPLDREIASDPVNKKSNTANEGLANSESSANGYGTARTAKPAIVDQPLSRNLTQSNDSFALGPHRTLSEPHSPITSSASSVDVQDPRAVSLTNPAAVRESSLGDRSRSGGVLESTQKHAEMLQTLKADRARPNFTLSRASSSGTGDANALDTKGLVVSANDKRDGDDSYQATIRSDPLSANLPNADFRAANIALPQFRQRVLSKKYWMRDENAKDCFYCGDAFSTFRRKHHCRTCGQIFDSKCMSIVSGRPFDQPGTLRVCKPCEAIVNGNDDSSEYSDNGSVSNVPLRPRHGSTGASDSQSVRGLHSPDARAESLQRTKPQSGAVVPKMAIPATRRVGDETTRRPAVLEIEAERSLVRPSSSRSLRSSMGQRPFTTAHKRYHSRPLRENKSLSEEQAPFHSNPSKESSRDGRLPAFHNDSIIDPDLAPYLSDEDSSGDEQVSIATAMTAENLSKSNEHDKSLLFGPLSAVRKSRSRVGDKSPAGFSFANRDSDSVSMSSLRAPATPHSARKRNPSMSKSLQVRPSPRTLRVGGVMGPGNSNLQESISSSSMVQTEAGDAPLMRHRMIRSSSMCGTNAPAIELNSASLRHVRMFLRQLLKESSVPDIASWEKALVPILLQATDDVNPDVHSGDDIDIRHYVKLKKISGGRPGDSSYVSGLVFTKNLALKSMPRNIAHPSILILAFPIEYARHEQHFMSLEPVIRQEREFLQNLVSRIAALRPQLLLVQRNVSGLALELLDRANIATAYNVKISVLEAVSRCCRTRIISSIDKLAVKPAQTGRCENFYLKTYVHGKRKKTYMHLSGCPKELGCTIALRGANDSVLARMKRITEFMVYVVYNLKLETSLMRDEFALIPSSIDVGSLNLENGRAPQILQKSNLESGIHGSSSDMDEKVENIPTSGISDDNAGINTQAETLKQDLTNEIALLEEAPAPSFYSDMTDKLQDTILSASPFVKFMQPYLLMRAREQERRLLHLRRLRDRDNEEAQDLDEKEKLQKFCLITPEMVHENIQNASMKVREVLRAVHDAEYDKALHNWQVNKKQWEAYVSGNVNLFDPLNHQNIVVLYSVVCTVTTVPCSGPDLLALSFYNERETEEDFEADCTLGQYVEDLCLGADTICTANGCERRMLDHHRQYVHGDAQVSVFVQPHPSKLHGLQNTILMWSCCKICGKETQVLPMSDNSWKYSFGKYLELSFWSNDLRARANVCPHDLHRDHLRYFGLGDFAVRVHYDRISLLEIIVPRARITWKVDNDLRFKNDLFTKIQDRTNRFMCSVKARIKGINVESVVPEKIEACKSEVERMTRAAVDEHQGLVKLLQDKYMNSKYFETIPMNWAIRATQEKVAEWDGIFANFERNFLPSEKDIRRLATLQLRKIFLDSDEPGTPSISKMENTVKSMLGDEKGRQASPSITPALVPQTRQMSPERAHDMLASVVQENSGDKLDQDLDHTKSAPPTAISTCIPSPTQNPLQDRHIFDVPHLDLAVPSVVLEKSTEKLGLPDPEFRSMNPTDTRDLPAKEGASEYVSEKINDLEVDNSKQRLPVISKDFAPPAQNNNSMIPRPTGPASRRPETSKAPPLLRAKSQPVRNVFAGSEDGNDELSSTPKATQFTGYNGETARESPSRPVSGTAIRSVHETSYSQDSDTPKASGKLVRSLIPRSTITKRNNSRVSTLAKHFEQLSREFEKERLRERRQRAAKSRRTRAYPMAASKPVVEIYRNVHEAVEEKEPSDEDLELEISHDDTEKASPTLDSMVQTTDSRTPGEGFHAEDTTAENTETDENTQIDSHTGSDADRDGDRSDDETSALEDIHIPGASEEHHALSPTEAQLDMRLDLPKHEKTSLMKMLTNFWAERSASGWQALEYPLNATDHVFADSDIIIREDEPSSLIAFALGSQDYRDKLNSITQKSGSVKSTNEKSYLQDPSLDGDSQVQVERALLRSTGTHLKYSFEEGSAKMLCKIFYAEQFDAVRRKCGASERIVESLSRCLKWDSKGGKTKSVFLKTLDDRLVLKSLSPIEAQAFLRFAPAYFQIMSEALFHELPSVIAKMLGFFQVIIKNPVTGVDFNWSMIVMENLFYDRSPKRIFDLKGSMRNRRIQSTGEQNEVLLDENMVEFIYESPLFAREHSKKLLRASVWNDTLFLARQNVMDYSLMIAVDEERKELVVGIIDCIRTYTWDKKLESWIKDRGKNRPTVTSPKEYKSRFREAMGRYVLQAPNCWHQFQAQQIEKRPLVINSSVEAPDGDRTEAEVAVVDVEKLKLAS